MLRLALLLAAVPLAAQYYVASTVAGTGQLNSRAGGPALEARLVAPRFVALARNGDVLISDSYFNQVYRIGADGRLTVLAGAGRQGFAGDNGPATEALLDSPGPLLVDPAGNILIADQANGRIRRVAPDGVITTLANPGSVAGMTLDAEGNLYYTNTGVHTIRRRASSGATTLFAGSDSAGFSGDGGPAASARLNSPQGLAFDADGNLLFADSQNQRIRRITPAGVISTVAGNGTAGFSGDSGPATAASLLNPANVAFDAAGNLLVIDTGNGRIRTVNRQGIIATIVGGGNSNIDGAALGASLAGTSSVAIDSTGRLVLPVPTARLVRRVTQNAIATIAGVLPASAGISGPGLSTTLLEPVGLAVDANRNLFIADTIEHRVFRLTPDGVLSTVAGNGFFAITGNDGPAANAAVGAPRGLALDASRNLFISSGAGASLRRVTPAGIITLVSGGSGGYAGDSEPASQGRFLNIDGLAVDSSGGILIADSGNNRVRRIDPSNRLSTIAGNGTRGFAGDGGPAAAAQFASPRYLALDRDGRIYISDTANHRIRRIGRDGIVTTIAGNGNPGFTGDGGPALEAALGSPLGLALDPAGNLFVVSLNRVRRVDAASGAITTIAGNGAAAFSGDGGLAANASFDVPQGLALDDTGALYVADSRNFRIRKLTPARIVAEGVANGATLRAGPVAPGMIVSIFGFDLGPATPAGLRLEPSGRVSTELASTRVFFDDIPAPLLFTSTGQVNAVVPYGVRGERTSLRVEFDGRPTNVITVPVVAASPGLFAVTNQNGQVNAAATPAAPGSALILYGTGEGQTNPAGVDGSVSATVFPRPLLDVSVTIGGQAANVLYAGAAPGFVAGVLQVNVLVPTGLSGSVPLVVRVGDASTPARNVFVQ